MRIVVLTAALGVGVLLAGAGVASVARTTDSSEPRIALTPNALTRQGAIDRVRAQGLTAQRIDRIEAKLTTWGVLNAAHGQNLSGLDTASARPVWIVAVAGEFVPGFGAGRSFPWGALVFDAESGQPIASFAGPESWPSFFGSLRDLAAN